MCCGVGLTESMSTVISAIGNVGPGLGAFGPAFSWAALPDAAKWILSALMLIGRLEIFGICYSSIGDIGKKITCLFENDVGNFPNRQLGQIARISTEKNIVV